MSEIKYVAVFSPEWWRNEYRREQAVMKDGDETGFPSDLGGGTGGGSIRDYDASKGYDKDDIIIKDGDFYQANEDIPANSAFLVGTNGLTWREISSSVLTMMDFTASRGYVTNTVVYHKNSIYRAKVDTNPGPFNKNQWEVLNADQANRVFAKPHDDTRTYEVGELIFRDNKLMRAKLFQSGAFDPANWEYIEAEYVLAISNYVNNGEYIEKELVVHNSRLWRAKVAMSSPGTFNSSNWEQVGSGGGIEEYVASKSYLAGDVVTQSDFIYRCKEDNVTGVFDQTKWLEVGGRSRFRGGFIPGTGNIYKKNDVVFHQNQLWMANSLISEPSDFVAGTGGSTFRSLSRQGAIAPFIQDRYYVEGDHVFYERVIYKAKTSKQVAAWDFADWEFVEDVSSEVNGYRSNIQYRIGNIIIIDGKLHRCINDILTPKVFDSADWEDISGGMRGIFDMSLFYRKGDVAIFNNNFYRANGNIAAGTAFSEGTSATSWTRLAPPANPSAPDWADGTEYNLHDLVINEGSLFRCIEAHIADTSIDMAKFQSLKAEGVAAVADFKVGEDYVKEQLIVSGGTLYRCRAQLNAATADDGPAGINANTYWQAVSLTYLNLGDHSDQATYRANELVIYNQKLYRAKANIDTPLTFDLAQWEPISEEVFVVKEFDVAVMHYPAGSLIYRNGVLLRCNVDVTDQTFDAAEWDEVTPDLIWKGTFDSGMTYHVGDKVIYANALWETVVEHTGTWTDADFKRVNSGLGAKEWQAETQVAKDDVLYNEQSMYVVTESHTTPLVFSDNKLQFIGSFLTTIDDYDELKEYVVGDLIYHLKGIWRCQAAGVGFTEANWKLLASHKHLIKTHDQTKAYEAGEQVIFDNKMYIANMDVVANTAFDPEDGNWLLVSSNAVATEAWEAEVAVTTGEVRIVKGIRMKSRTGRTTGTILDDTELQQWQLESVTTDNKAVLKWEGDEIIRKGYLMDLTGKVYESNGTVVSTISLTATVDLPTSQIDILKGLGYRFLLNNLDVTDQVIVNIDTTRFSIADCFLDKGDLIEIVSP